MNPIGFSPSSLKEGRWYEYLVRFALGGTATVFTGFVSSCCGASIGGLFLALRAEFSRCCARRPRHAVIRDRVFGEGGTQHPGRLLRRIARLVGRLGCGLVDAPQDAVGPEEAERGQNQWPRGFAGQLRSKQELQGAGASNLIGTANVRQRSKN